MPEAIAAIRRKPKILLESRYLSKNLYMKRNVFFALALLLASLMSISFLPAQTVKTVATGMGSNFSMSVGGNMVYKRNAADVVKADLSQPLPTSAVTLLTVNANLRGVLVVGDYLYLTATSANLPGLSCSVGRINLTVMNPTIEAVATNLTGNYGTVGLLNDGDDLYIGATGGTLNGIYKVNLAAPFPQNATELITGEQCFNIALHGNDMYFTDPSYSIIKKFDISQLNPVATTVISGGQMVGLNFNRDYLYFCDLASPAGIKRIDVTQPVPVIETILPDQQNVNSLAIDGNYLYFAMSNGTVSRASIATADECATATDINNLFGASYNAPQISSLHDNTNYNNISDPTTGIECHVGDPGLKHTIWYSFTGDGNTYRIRAVQCSATNYNDDTQVAIYSGNCDALTPVACNDDENFASTLYNFNVELATVPGQTYRMLVDGYGESQGEFCLEVTNLTATAIVFPPSGTVCENSSFMDSGPASPNGGVYSGPGVTDIGDGISFLFSASAAGGPGTYAITYTLGGQTASSTIIVAALPVISVFGFVTNVTTPTSLLPDPSAGPAGGVYSGVGVLPGNMFDAGLAGVGVHLLTYTFTDANGCTGTGTGTITVNPAPHDACNDAKDINNLFGGSSNVPQTSSLQNNTGYTSTGDPAVNSGCFFQDDALQHTIWYTFSGDGNMYRIRSVQCTATNYIQDTQVAIFSGDCSNPTQVACNDDEDVAANIYNISVDIATQAGQTYWILMDGYGGLQGEFCLEVTNLSPSAVTEIGQTNIRVSPNPTTGIVQLTNVQADEVQVFDATGRLIFAQSRPGATLDLSGIPAGMYFLKIREKEALYSVRLIRQ